jgi:hypothetical protein
VAWVLRLQFPRAHLPLQTPQPPAQHPHKHKTITQKTTGVEKLDSKMDDHDDVKIRKGKPVLSFPQVKMLALML